MVEIPVLIIVGCNEFGAEGKKKKGGGIMKKKEEEKVCSLLKGSVQAM